MFKNIKKYFAELRIQVDRGNILASFNRKDVTHSLSELEALKIEVAMFTKAILANLSEVNKKLSSIEMELLMNRGACLDNNFPGKEDL